MKHFNDHSLGTFIQNVYNKAQRDYGITLPEYSDNTEWFQELMQGYSMMDDISTCAFRVVNAYQQSRCFA
jgi:hypothetical protein